MKRLYSFLLPFMLVFSLFLAGCGGNTEMPAGNEVDALATMVAATVEAALDAPPADAPVPTLAAPTADAPAPTLASVPTEIPASPAPAVAQVLRVVYVKDGNLYLWTEGGGSVALTNTGDAVRVRISDDAQVVAFVRQLDDNFFTQELWAVNTSLPYDEHLLVSFAEMDTLLAASPFPSADGLGFNVLEWRPGTHQLGYGTVPLYEGPGSMPSEDVRFVDADTLAKSTLFDFGAGGRFRFSPDGNQLVLSTPDHISLVNVDGSNLRAEILTYPQVGTYSEYQYHPSPVWAADSASLRVAIPPEDPLAEPASPTVLWYIPTDGSPARQLSSIFASPFIWVDEYAFSPDLFQVAYVKDAGGNQQELHIAGVNGTSDYVFAVGAGLFFEQWSPNSARFLYSMTGMAEQGIFLGDGLGNSYTISSNPSTVGQMNWVDNSRFLYLYQNGANWELRISDVDGTNHAFLDTISEQYAAYDFVVADQ